MKRIILVLLSILTVSLTSCTVMPIDHEEDLNEKPDIVEVEDNEEEESKDEESKDDKSKDEKPPKKDDPKPKKEEPKPTYTKDEIVKKVLNGDFGTGADRKAKVESLGFNYGEIQSLVDKEVSKSKPKTETPKPSAPKPSTPKTEAPEKETPKAETPKPQEKPKEESKPAPKPEASNGKLDSAMAKEMFNIINKERQNAGLSNLKWAGFLEAGANTRAKEIDQKFSHTRPNGTSWSTVHNDAHGENIAFGYPNSASAMVGFMNSQGHRNNILNDSFKSVAIGVYKDANGTPSYVQLFSYK